MTETKTCPKCGSPMPVHSPEGICPSCLMLAGLESRPENGTGAEIKPTTLTSGFVPPAPEDLSSHFPQLEILELLGKGGMGAVYKARQPGLDRLVAVKILPPEIGADPAFAERFAREARALAKLSHQNIVSVFDIGTADGQFYFIMEYVDGTNLRQLIESGELKPEEALAIVPQICEALQFAHNEGIVHRDIKPENILIDKQGRVKIADFGLAKLLDKPQAGVTLTAAHQVMGTLHYMAPEQMRGAGSVDHRADIYSLGVVFYEMLTGQLPIGKFELPSKKVHIDVRLDEVVLRALESQPEKRYQRASELKHDTERVSSSQNVRSVVAEVSAAQPSDPLEAAARRLRKPMGALFVVGLAQALVAGALVVWLSVVLVKIHATPASPEATSDSESSGSGGTTMDSTVTVTHNPHPWRPYLGFLYAMLFTNLIAVVIGLLAMAAAVFGSRLEMERFVRSMCGLVCLPSPVWLFAIPTAIIALSALSRSSVKQAFAAVLEQDAAEPRPSILSNWTVWTTLCSLPAILAVVSALLPWSQAYIFGIGLQNIGLDGWHGIVVGATGVLATILVAAFSVIGNSRSGQGLSAFVGGVVIAAIGGYFVWEIAHPAPPETSVTVTGDDSMQEFGEKMADSFADLLVGGIQVRTGFGAFAAIVCGVLLAVFGAGQLVRPGGSGC